jgi:hypothetical protein
LISEPDRFPGEGKCIGTAAPVYEEIIPPLAASDGEPKYFKKASCSILEEITPES